ncbi:MAG TPA: serine/threonine-protein kinase, partial [Kofleriaceae bacterium]|nr:serine/threonine-protein kinase [Kofleriaceae bacterium]
MEPDDVSADAPPARTIGRYRVLAVLGAGAMGEVVRARDDRLGRDVAIKRMKVPARALAEVFAARFEAEGRALASLTHPGVVQVFDLGVDGDEPYLVMELVDGPTLRDVVRDRGPLPVAEVRAAGIQLARALEAAHARGVLHRDVKPANVLLAPRSVWKLADFGLAHLPDSSVTLSGQFLGTPAYAAPEALALGQFGPPADVFGLAATLYEAATGARPH